MKLLVVILCYKVPDLTIDCLRTVAGEIQHLPETRVAVLENGTGGDAFEKLRNAIDAEGWNSWCDLTSVHPNRGFCAGNNLVIRPALQSDDPPEYILLLNADTLVREHALGALVEFMDAHPQAGIAGSQLLSTKGEIQGSPFRFPGVLTELDRGLRVGILTRLIGATGGVPPTPAEACSVEWVSGASMILRSSMLRQVGLLDEGLYTYFDDIDICLRARRAGWQTWYVPESKVVHLQGSSTVFRKVVMRRPAYWFEARRRFFLKNYGPIVTTLADAAFLGGFATWRLRERIKGETGIDPPLMLSDSFRHSVFRRGFAIQEVENPAMREFNATRPASDVSVS